VYTTPAERNYRSQVYTVQCLYTGTVYTTPAERKDIPQMYTVQCMYIYTGIVYTSPPIQTAATTYFK
jgi:hypothetical protein